MQKKIFAVMVAATLSVPAIAETISASGTVQAIASGTPRGPALRVYVRDGDVDVLSGCEGQYAYVEDGKASAEALKEAATGLYFSGQYASFRVERDAAGWCRLIEAQSAH